VSRPATTCLVVPPVDQIRESIPPIGIANLPGGHHVTRQLHHRVAKPTAGGKDLTAKSPGKVKAGGKIKFNEF